MISHPICQADSKYLRILQNEFLKKRPYTKHMFLTILRKPDNYPKGAEVVEACLKAMGQEDLILLTVSNQEEIAGALSNFKCKDEKLNAEIQKVFVRIRHEALGL